MFFVFRRVLITEIASDGELSRRKLPVNRSV
jgi:hypothetical protein